MRRWTTDEIRYLKEHAGDGTEAVAEALGRTPDSVKRQAARCGVSLRRRWKCPRCGMLTFKPLNRANGWCAECTKEARVSYLMEQADAMREEAERARRNDRERQRLYSAKSTARKNLKKWHEK